MRAQRGVSLVEALVALAVMAFGMMAIVGVQSTMRQNADIAKQRSEAVRIAQEAIERWRAYSVLDTTAGRTAYADIATQDDEIVAGYQTNTSYTLSRTVTDLPGQNQKALQVGVSWADRNGATQAIQLNSVVALSDPAIAGVLFTPPAGNPSKRPRNRHAAIPMLAKDMGGGLSAFKPPAPGGSTVAWVFNNVTGLIVGVCNVAAATTTEALTTSDIASCSNNTVAQLLSGYVRFSTGLVQPTAADAENPSSNARNLDMALLITSTGHPGDPSCFDDAPVTTSAAILQTAVTYYCAIPANSSRSWAGYLSIMPQAFDDDPSSEWKIPSSGNPGGSHTLCRYTPAVSDTQWVPNWQHPFRYRIEYADPAPGPQLKPLPMPPLPNQNFLVVLDGFSCPADGPPDPALGDFVNSNTLVHLPWP